MSIAVQIRRGTDSQNTSFTGAAGELIYTTDQKKVYVHDGSTAGGTLVSGGSGTTNLSTTANGTSLTVNSDTGTNASIPAATTSAWGAMTDEDKNKLDGIAASANNYVHPNHTGDVTSTGDGATVIANNAVTTAKINNNAVTSDKLATTLDFGSIV
jgi:hypothetical protein